MKRTLVGTTPLLLLFLSTILLFIFPALTLAEIFECNGTFQNKPCGKKEGKALNLPKLSSYEGKSAARYNIKDEEIELGADTSSPAKNLNKPKKMVRPSSVSKEEKLQKLEREGRDLRDTSSRLLSEIGEQGVYAKARDLLLDVDNLCTVSFEKSSFSIENRCEKLRKDIAKVSRAANQ